MTGRAARTISVRVIPHSPRPRVEEEPDGSYRVHVSALPDKGKANAEMVRTIAKHLGVPRGDITIVSGHASRMKVLRVEAVRD